MINSKAGSFSRVAFKLSPTGEWDVLPAEGKVRKGCTSLWNIVNKSFGGKKKLWEKLDLRGLHRGPVID